MANAEKILYTAGNPLRYEPVPPECAFTELDREHSRLVVDRAMLRGELFDVRAELKGANRRAFWATVGLGLYTVGALVVVGILLLR